MMVMADGRRRWYDRRENAPDPGDSVTLTIDETIQYIAEKELRAAIEQTHAKAGTVVVQDPNNGELLAVANYPEFDPNDAGSYPAEARMDRAVSAAYEPGSTFKLITLTGAIENGVASPDELIDCQMGSIVLGKRVIHDHKAYGILSVRQILEDSSNVGAIKVALKLGAPRFYDTIRSFGIGQPTGIELPGENRGLLRPVEDWSANSIGSLAMGQEVSVTPIQIISAASAVANGGTLYPARIVRDISGDQPVPNPIGAQPRQATDAETAATMREMMEGVMIAGTGRLSQLDGYTSGGKSGTAQQIDPATGRYSATKYNASFVVFAPVNNPVVTIFTVLDSPVGKHMGAEVSAPVDKRVAEQVLAYMNVPRDVPAPSQTETAKNTAAGRQHAAAHTRGDDAAQASFEAAVARKSSDAAPTIAVGDLESVAVPDLSGKTVRAVMEECSRLGFAPSLIGTGVALEQYPAAGTEVPRGSRLTVRFGRPGELLPTSARGGGN